MTLIAAYGFGAGSGSTITDDSGNGHALTIDSASWTASGHTGSGLQNSTNLATTGASGTVPSVSGNSCTVMAWVTPSNLSSGSTHLICGSLDSGASTSFELWTQRGDFGTADVLQGNARIGGFGVVAVNGTSLTVGTAVHVALTFDGTTLKLWLNGTVVNSVTAAGGLANSSEFYVAGHAAEGTAAISMIDDVRYFDSDESANMTTWMNTPVGSTGGGTIVNGSAALAETSTLAVAASYIAKPQSALTEAATTSATATGKTFGSAALSEAATFTAAASGMTGLFSSMSETSTLTGASKVTFKPTVGLTETATFTATAQAAASPGTWTTQSATQMPAIPYTPPAKPPDREYSVVAYNTVTGRVMADVDFTVDPTWSTVINDTGGWQITVPLPGGAGTAAVRGWCVPWLVSVAILLGDTVCQAGPIVAYQPSDTAATVQVSGKGLWEALNHRLFFNAAWDPSATRITDPSADLTITGPMWRIARELVNHATNWQHRLGGNLPIDLPDVLPADNSNTRTWHGWEMATPGQRLQELTQSDGGPDVLFQPYMTVVGGFRTIRHRMLVGTPYLQDLGVPLNFSYRRSLVSMTISGDGSKQANSAFVKGTGSEAGQMYGYATNTGQVVAGWPALDLADSNHTSSQDQTALDGWAAADLNLYGNVPEQWQATVRADADPAWGQYWPGHFANYSLKDHPWIPDGTYRTRILGVSGGGGGTQRGTIQHQLQTFRTS